MPSETIWTCPSCRKRFRLKPGAKPPAACKSCRPLPPAATVLEVPPAASPLAAAGRPQAPPPGPPAAEIVFVDIGPDEPPRTAPAKPQSVPQRLPSVFVPTRPSLDDRVLARIGSVVGWFYTAFRPGGKRRTTWQALFLVFSLGGAGMWLLMQLDGAHSSTERICYGRLQTEALKHLKAPATAKFDPNPEFYQEGNEMFISAWVESQNSFGVPLRGPLTGTLKLIQGRWTLTELKMDGEVYFSR